MDSLPFTPLHSAILECDTIKAIAALLASHPDKDAAKVSLQILAERSGANSNAEDIRAYQAGADKLARDGEIEVDDEATVSMGGDGGAYVQAWLWVSDEVAGIDSDKD